MKKEIVISGKVLAQVVMPDFCPRCFWLKINVKPLPFQIFPGIFASIDSFSKKAMHLYFDVNGIAPGAVESLAAAKKYLPVLHHTKFRRADPDTGITVSGGMDDLYEMEDGTHVIPDYKTAKYTKSQDALHPLYEAQLNSYRWVHEPLSGARVSGLALVYFEPVNDNLSPAGNFIADGFSMGFSVKDVRIEIKDDLIPTLLSCAADIVYLPTAPAGFDGCKDCAAVEAITRASKE